jgi:hypothetical protein
MTDTENTAAAATETTATPSRIAGHTVNADADLLTVDEELVGRRSVLSVGSILSGRWRLTWIPCGSSSRRLTRR